MKIELTLKVSAYEDYKLNIIEDYGDWRIYEVHLKDAYLFKILYNLRPHQLYSGKMFFDLD